MKTVKAIQFVPLGRPPRKGEWAVRKSDGVYWVTMWDHLGLDYAEAVERREVEVEVEEPVPEWIRDLAANLRFEDAELDVTGHDSAMDVEDCRLCAARIRRISDAFRAHVEERARAAAERVCVNIVLPNIVRPDATRASCVDGYAAIIREEMLK